MCLNIQKENSHDLAIVLPLIWPKPLTDFCFSQGRERESSCLLLPRRCSQPGSASKSFAGMPEENESLLPDFTWRVEMSRGVRKAEGWSWPGGHPEPLLSHPHPALFPVCSLRYKFDQRHHNQAFLTANLNPEKPSLAWARAERVKTGSKHIFEVPLRPGSIHILFPSSKHRQTPPTQSKE